jgi:hypothetical protein
MKLVEFWMARLRVILVDHLVFIAEDLEYDPKEHEVLYNLFLITY